MVSWIKTHKSKRTDLEQLESLEAVGLWQLGNLYCAASDLDGVFEQSKLPIVAMRLAAPAKLRRLAEDLVDAGLWTAQDGAYEIVGWLDDQPPADVWDDDVKRERHLRGKRLGRDRVLCEKIKRRDRNLCRYCGERVDWLDRKGPFGGTYDHVDPDGENTYDNVVVACRACNTDKRDRTPEQWVAERSTGRTLKRSGTSAAVAASIDARPRRERPMDDDDPVAVRPRSDPGLTGGPDSLGTPPDSGPDLTPVRPGSDRGETEGEI
jgi:5-methylcytosine-specific restriction endonuclease McrA